MKILLIGGDKEVFSACTHVRHISQKNIIRSFNPSSYSKIIVITDMLSHSLLHGIKHRCKSVKHKIKYMRNTEAKRLLSQ